MATVRITNLKLRTIIGINSWERKVKQDIVLNITLDYDAAKAAKSDNIKDAVDYKAITKEIIKEVEKTKFFLIEKLAAFVLDIVMANKRIKKAAVRIDKPMALRFTESVSVEISRKR